MRLKNDLGAKTNEGYWNFFGTPIQFDIIFWPFFETITPNDHFDMKVLAF